MKMNFLKSTFAAIIAILTFCPHSFGQNDSIAETLSRIKFTDRSDMCFQMRGSFNLEMPQNEKIYSRFRIDDFRWNIEGTVGKQFYYRFRQSFNTAFKTMSWDNLLSSVNYAFVTWKPNEKVSFTAGKQVFALGGHEFWATPVYVVQFSDFGKSLSAYQLGLNANWSISPTQELVFQVCNIRGNSDSEYYYAGLPDGVSSARFPYIYTLNWNGNFLKDKSLEFRYSASYGNQAENKSMWILSLGQSWRNRKWGVYFDVMWSRQALDASSIISSSMNFADGASRTATNTQYLSSVAYLHFFISPSFNIFVKGAGEAGGFYKPYMNAGPGICRVNWNAQGCLQYMPTKDKGFRLFAHYNFYNRHASGDGKLLGITSANDHLVSLGIIYIMNVF